MSKMMSRLPHGEVVQQVQLRGRPGQQQPGGFLVAEVTEQRERRLRMAHNLKVENGRKPPGKSAPQWYRDDGLIRKEAGRKNELAGSQVPAMDQGNGGNPKFRGVTVCGAPKRAKVGPKRVLKAPTKLRARLFFAKNTIISGAGGFFPKYI